MAEHDHDVPDVAEPIEGELARAIAAMHAGTPPSQVTGRVLAALGRQLGDPGQGSGQGPAPGGEPASGPVSSGVSSTVVSKAVTAGLIALAIGVSVLGARRIASPEAASVASASAAAQPAIEASAQLDPAPALALSASASAAASSSDITAPAVPLGLAPALPGEGQLLAGAKRLLPTDPAGAIRLLQQHARLYPDGMLRQEREVLLIEAKARQGRTDEAQLNARRFLEQHPDTAYENKIRESAFGDASADHNSRP